MLLRGLRNTHACAMTSAEDALIGPSASSDRCALQRSNVAATPRGGARDTVLYCTYITRIRQRTCLVCLEDLRFQ